MNEREGHDHDADLTPECPVCHEITPDPEHHRCVIIYPPDSCLQEQP